LLFWKTAFSRFLLKSPLLRVHFKQIIHCGIIALEIFFSSVDSSEFSIFRGILRRKKRQKVHSNPQSTISDVMNLEWVGKI